MWFNTTWLISKSKTNVSSHQFILNWKTSLHGVDRVGKGYRYIQIPMPKQAIYVNTDAF
jgi:hypothetical protein